MAPEPKSTDGQPEQRLLRWPRRQKVRHGVEPGGVSGPGLGWGLPSPWRRELLLPWQPFPSPTASSSFSSLSCVQACDGQSRASGQEERPDSCRASGEQAAAAGAESRAAAPHSPRGRGQALLRSLQRRARAALSRMAAVIRPRGQRPATQRHPSAGEDALVVAAAAAPAAGPESQAASLHSSPSCSRSPSPGPLEGWHWVVTEAEAERRRRDAALAWWPPALEEGSCSQEVVASVVPWCDLGSDSSTLSWSTEGRSDSISLTSVSPIPSGAWSESSDQTGKREEGSDSLSLASVTPSECSSELASGGSHQSGDVEEQSDSLSLTSVTPIPSELASEGSDQSGDVEEQSDSLSLKSVTPVSSELVPESSDQSRDVEEQSDSLSLTSVTPIPSELRSESGDLGGNTEEGSDSVSCSRHSCASWCEEDSLQWDTEPCSEQTPAECSAAAVATRRPSPFRKALRALRGGFGRLQSLFPSCTCRRLRTESP